MKLALTELPQRKAETILYVGLFFAIFISPFIGGIRGLPVYLGWLLIPLAQVFWTKDWAHIGLGPDELKFFRLIRVIIISLLLGIISGLLLLLINNFVPSFLRFVLILPSLHRQMTFGSPVLLIALTPVAHFVHEIFYRGLIQLRLKALFSSSFLAIFSSAVLFGWTHVFIYSSFNYPSTLRITLFPVILFVLIESIIAGFLLEKTNNLFSSVTYRASNLIVISIVLFW